MATNTHNENEKPTSTLSLSRICSRVKDRRSFTLIELLVVLAILAILSITVILTINPQELIKQGRDSTRLSDMAQLNSALNTYQVDSSISDSGQSSFGTASTTYVSIPDPTATSTTEGNACTGLGLPTLPSGYSYHCSASSTYRNVDGTGWIPVNFSSISYGSPLGTLPVDPVNTTSSGNYYTYTPGGSWQLTAVPESQKVRTTQADQTTGAITAGTDLTLSPLFSQAGLVGYWKFDEGTGTSTVDSSGNNNVGTLVSSPSWTTSGCKVGNCLSFSATNQNVNVGNPSSIQFDLNTPFSVAFWVKLPTNTASIGFARKTATIHGLGWYVWSWNGSNHLAFNIYPSPNTNIGVGSTGVITDNNWHHAVAIYDGTSNRSGMKLYIDGIINATGTALATTGSIINTTNITFSAAGGGGAGLLDDMRIYNRALSAAEIMALYNATR